MSGNLNKAVNENREAIKQLVQSLEVPRRRFANRIFSARG